MFIPYLIKQTLLLIAVSVCLDLCMVNNGYGYQLLQFQISLIY